MITEHDRFLRRERQKRFRMRERNKCLLSYGGRCVDCGEKNLDLLELDHENEDGAERRREIFGSQIGGIKFYIWLRQHGYPQDLGLRCRCQRCHDKKHYPELEEPRPRAVPVVWPVSGTDEEQIW